MTNEIIWDIRWDMGFGIWVGLGFEIGMGFWQMGWDMGWDGIGDSSIPFNMGGNTEAIYCTSKTEYRISLTKDILKDSTDLRKNVKRILEVIVGLLKDRLSASEEPANKKRRTFKEAVPGKPDCNCREKVDCNCHPIRLTTGALGVGKTQFLLECVNHFWEKYPEFLKNLVDVVVISYNNGNLPSDLDKQLVVKKNLSLHLLHATFVNPIRKFDDFANDLKKAEIDINITFKFALTIVCEELGIQLTDNWLIVIAIGKFNKILTHFENDTSRRFLSMLSQILGSVMCNPPEHTTVIGLMAGTMVVTINSIFRELSYDRISMCFSSLNIYERTAEILLALDRFPPEWRIC
ncbi:hypothetical protein RhiirC2_797709 [Rhizophagus irregularis]|uniref:Uncharacterized protein n=1 Tax=Rhizophagus irregularis TaxID=588596 RepID=A0A2N1M7M0_9GLOM|nr:hypothetical protein RhiirC2_797709 [Rhizophagus irregularis]